MIVETAGGMIPFICHVFLILFGGFFGLSFAFNKSLGLLRIDFNHTTQGIGQVICLFFGVN